MADMLLKPPNLAKTKSSLSCLDTIFAGAEAITAAKEELVRCA